MKKWSLLPLVVCNHSVSFTIISGLYRVSVKVFCYSSVQSSTVPAPLWVEGPEAHLVLSISLHPKQNVVTLCKTIVSWFWIIHTKHVNLNVNLLFLINSLCEISRWRLILHKLLFQIFDNYVPTLFYLLVVQSWNNPLARYAILTTI